MAELDQILEKILRDGQPIALPIEDMVADVKKAFINAGWVKLHGRGAYDALEESMRLIQQPLMTGQEWYDRFEQELDKVTTSVNGVIDSGLTTRSVAKLAAKKAAGIE